MRVAATPPLVLYLAVALVAGAAGPAAADEVTANAAARLFLEGREAITAGRIDEACNKFEASLKLDPAIGTKLNLADCLERQGLHAAAYRLFKEAAREGAKTGKEGREDFARQRATALIGKLVKIEVRFEREPTAGTVVTIGGVEIAADAWKEPRYVMPGAIEVTVTPAVGDAFTTTVEAAAGDKRRVVVPAREATPAGATIPPPPPARLRRDAPVAAPGKNRTLAYIVGGGGTAMLGTSLALGLAARSKFNAAACGPAAGLADGQCTVAGQRDTDRARTLADVGTGIGIAGLAAVGVGVYLFVRTGRGSGSGRDDVIVTPAVSDDAVGVVVLFRR